MCESSDDGESQDIGTRVTSYDTEFLEATTSDLWEHPT